MTPDPEYRPLTMLQAEQASVPAQLAGMERRLRADGQVPDRRRPLRDLAQQEVGAMTDAEKVSLIAYWASVAPAAFLLAREAFEQDTRW